LLYTPSDDLSVKFNFDTASSDENSNTKPFMVDPATLDDGSLRTTTYTTRLARGYFGGYTPIIGSWDEIDLDMAKPVQTDNSGLSAVLDWRIGPVTFTSVTAARQFHFDAGNDQEQTRFAIARNGTRWSIRINGRQEFRFTGSAGETIDYQAGLYFLQHRDRHDESNALQGGRGRVLRGEQSVRRARGGARVAAGVVARRLRDDLQESRDR
jgi:iron complex outermembrane receptor protein